MALSSSKIDKVSKMLIGIPYKHFGRSIEDGLDCWGLILKFYELLRVKIKDYEGFYEEDWDKCSNLLSKHTNIEFTEVVDKLPGDLVLMSVKSHVINHAGILVNNNLILHTDYIAGVHKVPVYSVASCIRKYKRHVSLI